MPMKACSCPPCVVWFFHLFTEHTSSWLRILRPHLLNHQSSLQAVWSSEPWTQLSSVSGDFAYVLAFFDSSKDLLRGSVSVSSCKLFSRLYFHSHSMPLNRFGFKVSEL